MSYFVLPIRQTKLNKISSTSKMISNHDFLSYDHIIHIIISFLFHSAPLTGVAVFFVAFDNQRSRVKCPAEGDVDLKRAVESVLEGIRFGFVILIHSHVKP